MDDGDVAGSLAQDIVQSLTDQSLAGTVQGGVLRMV